MLCPPPSWLPSSSGYTGGWLLPSVSNAFYHLPCFPLLPHCLRHLSRPSSLVSDCRCTSSPRRTTALLLRHPQRMHPCTASIHPPRLPSPRVAPSSYFVLTRYPLPVLYHHPILALPPLNIIWSHCPLLLPLLHADLKDDRFMLCGDILATRTQHFAALHPPELLLSHHV